MLLFGITMLVVLMSLIFAGIALGVSGAAFILVFGDALVCVMLFVVIIKYLFKKKSK